MSRRVLILGASGHSGSAFARAFAEDGWDVRRYRRGDDPARAAQGADLIVNAMNPPDYHDWARQIPAITELAMTAARASGARVLIPGNVYVFGQEPAPWSAETPHHPCSRKGRIRSDMEAAWRASGLPVTILRAGDFIDGAKPGLMMGRVMLKHLGQGKITALGPPDVRRAYAYLPDVARAAVALSRKDDLPRFADIPFPGHSFSLTEMASEITRQTGQDLRITRFPWWTLRMASPVWELARELYEMRYLFAHPHWLDGAAFEAAVPEFVKTPFSEVVASHLPGRS
ncbi:NmrA family NAD(P)-binding protein [Salipiger sp. PrR002]|uniref:NmrA family NAD(P)-binding protein n=1 Tax=Salipiger sp. PrR002 TaxID=2706489 RepID=UPI0013B9D04A|nr:NmrA family NAD(P)-binding protein [Salipiger sp. PrR002]NDW02617.1 NmrA family NAD(P)-binding protein [Salipiger sp. PrR002]NDW59818.1 NmrA family NAD(P)-binding protein [Salipiger sp. PrR004]